MLLEALIVASERAANIARKCRENERLFQLLIEEKAQDEANPRFVQDFKTLADVLIQETVRHDIGNKYPEMKDNIRGEESNVFCNALGEQINVEKLETCHGTANLLSKVLNDDVEAARLLAEEVHRELRLNDVNTPKPEAVTYTLDYSKLGIWIDPIDSTAEYISGTKEQTFASTQPQIFTSGLNCVTVLIGVYDLDTGNAIMGVVNQPFDSYQADGWRGRCRWGVNTESSRYSSMSAQSEEALTVRKVVCLSSSEDQRIKDKLRSGGFTLIEAAGAGYKMLATVIGLADAYVLSKSSTFAWDSCGPQALLKSISGDIVVYKDAVETGTIVGVKYRASANAENKIDSCCNKGGIIAFRDRHVLERIIQLLSDTKDENDA